VDLAKADRAPLLLIAGGKDHVIPPQVVEKQYKSYTTAKSRAVVEYEVFAGRSHGIINQPGWQEVADAALDFAERNIRYQ